MNEPARNIMIRSTCIESKQHNGRMSIEDFNAMHVAYLKNKHVLLEKRFVDYGEYGYQLDYLDGYIYVLDRFNRILPTMTTIENIRKEYVSAVEEIGDADTKQEETNIRMYKMFMKEYGISYTNVFDK